LSLLTPYEYPRLAPGVLCLCGQSLEKIMWGLYVQVEVPIFWFFSYTYEACIETFANRDDACGYAFNVCGFTNCNEFTVRKLT